MCSGVDIRSCNWAFLVSCQRKKYFRCLYEQIHKIVSCTWQTSERETITFWIKSALHCCCSDPQITGNKRRVTNRFFSLPHHILFFSSLCFSCSLSLVSLLYKPCPSLTPLSPASLYFACPYNVSVCFLFSALEHPTPYPNQIWSVLFPGFYPVSLLLSSISLSAHVCVCYCVRLAMSQSHINLSQ